uniref:Uncharacterized protein n=1 Tax=Ananas comosus var. bracteatus TaxID=296719 RepID=A0A6V7NSW0_ANACO|nr:unnamed protein product [Ananas comosus var. bracteatus]
MTQMENLLPTLIYQFPEAKLSWKLSDVRVPTFLPTLPLSRCCARYWECYAVVNRLAVEPAPAPGRSIWGHVQRDATEFSSGKAAGRTACWDELRDTVRDGIGHYQVKYQTPALYCQQSGHSPRAIRQTHGDFTLFIGDWFSKDCSVTVAAAVSCLEF